MQSCKMYTISNFTILLIKPNYKTLQSYLYFIFQTVNSSTSHNKLVTLSIEFRQFPNFTLTSDFYRDQQEIYRIYFISCGLNYVAANAFNAKALRNLWCIEFLKYRSLEFDPDAFNGLNSLKQLIFNESILKNLNYLFLNPIAVHLTYALYSHLDPSINMYNLIGSVEYGKLKKIILHEVSFYEVITANSFTKMPIIEHIDICQCSTKAILLGAFDRLNETLKFLIFHNNHLKTLPSTFFDNLQNVVMVNDSFFGNPWECVCDIWALEVKYGEIFEDEFICNPARLPFDQNYCDGANVSSGQSVTLSAIESRKCWHHYGTNGLRVNFPTLFRLKVDDQFEHLFINATKRTSFYVLIVSMNESRMRYAAITGKSIKSSLDRFRMGNGAYILCILDPQNGIRITAMHCICFHRNQIENFWLSERAIYVASEFLAVIYVVALLLAISGGICLVRYKLKFLGNVERVVIIRNEHSNDIESVLVMPRSWIKHRNSGELQKLQRHLDIRGNRCRNANNLRIPSMYEYSGYMGGSDMLESPKYETVNYDYCVEAPHYYEYN